MMGKLAEAGIPYAIGPTTTVRWNSVCWYVHQLERVRPALIHLHAPNTELAHFLSERIALKRWSRAGGVLVRTIHNTELPSGWLLRNVYHANRVGCSIACGEAVAAAYAEIITGAVTPITNGVDFLRPVTTKDMQVTARQRLGLDGGSVHFVNVGRMPALRWAMRKRGTVCCSKPGEPAG